MRKNKKGDAMITVICIMAVFLALSLAAIFSASSLVSGAIKSSTREQCRLSAVTFSKVLEQEMTRESDYEDRKENKNMDSGLRNYIRAQMQSGSWTYYNENEAGHTDLDSLKKNYNVTSKIADMDEDAGKITVEIYWTAEAGVFAAYKDYSSAQVVIEVICEKKEQKQKIRTWYNVSYEAYDAEGNKQDTSEWDQSRIQTWEDGSGKILAWKWQVSEIR